MVSSASLLVMSTRKKPSQINSTQKSPAMPNKKGEKDSDNKLFVLSVKMSSTMLLVRGKENIVFFFE